MSARGQNILPGDILTASAWFVPDGDRSPLMLPAVAERWSRAQAEAACRRAIERTAANHKLALGPLRWTVLTPESQGLSAPPPAAPRGVHALIADALVTGLAPQFAPRPCAFVDALDRATLAALRAVERRAYARRHPKRPPLSDAACDRAIELRGPAVLAKRLSAA